MKSCIRTGVNICLCRSFWSIFEVLMLELIINLRLPGCSEMLMADAVDKAAAVTPGKESHAMESFAYALRQLPAIIAENGGYDAAQLVSELKAAHAQGNSTKGLGE